MPPPGIPARTRPLMEPTPLAMPLYLPRTVPNPAPAAQLPPPLLPPELPMVDMLSPLPPPTIIGIIDITATIPINPSITGTTDTLTTIVTIGIDTPPPTTDTPILGTTATLTIGITEHTTG